MLKLIKRIGLSATILMSLLSFSFARSENSLEEDFNKLKNIPANYQSFGSICEQVARLRLQEKFDKKKYDFLIGLEYKNSQRTLGEVDLLVVSKKNQKVFVVGEVKCWKNLKAAMVKAKKQLNYSPSHNVNEGIEAAIQWYWDYFKNN